ncbi:ABC transporter permease [Caldilinea sp.]|uniref:ABC transporter permease n=1 Tax=Caldilinea sp. TaxID=2293560 RepID=UPI002D00B7B0|nr:ABC transporter permease [Anaerolineales bacterium]HQY92010.1 ABC transporter permease [Caldilinea sp.]
MGRYAIRRTVQMIPLFIGISIIIFLIIQAAPGGPETTLLATGRFVSPEILAAYRTRLGLDQPIFVQYFRWLGAALTGDLGYSYTSAQPVLTMILERLPATIQLMLSAYLLAAVIALPLGVYSAIHKYSVLDYLGAGLSFLGIAMPVFWFGLILQLVFAVQLGWLPSSGRETVGDTGLVDQIKHLILPATVLSLLYIAGWSRYMRTSFLGVINTDYVRTARSKGLRERRVMLVHALKNAAIPVVSIMALDVAGLFSGAVITETIFAWPGIGRLFIQSMYARDYPLLMGIIMMGSILVVVFNLLADIMYGWLDPRISFD